MAEVVLEEFLHTIPLKDRPTFEFYYQQTANELLPVSPEYTWNQFDPLGYATFQESEGNTLADLDKTAAQLIPNYTERIGEFPALLDAFKDAPATAIKNHTDSGRAAIINCSHPSLATPILVARSLVEALGPESRQQLYIVYGLLPTIFEYKIEGQVLSPVSVARSLGNVMLTAAKTPSNESGNKEIENWQQTQRGIFKKVFDEVTAPKADEEKGAIVIVCITGQRNKLGPVLRPDGSLDYLLGHDVWSVGVDDALLGPDIKSLVWMKVDPNPISVRTNADVHASNRMTCELAGHGNASFKYEGRLAHTKRLMSQGAIAKVIPDAKKPRVLHLG